MLDNLIKIWKIFTQKEPYRVYSNDTKTINLTIEEASLLANVLMEMFKKSLMVYGYGKMPKEFINGLEIAEEITKRIKHEKTN